MQPDYSENWDTINSINDYELFIKNLDMFHAYPITIGTSKKRKDRILMSISVPQYCIDPVTKKTVVGVTLVYDYVQRFLQEQVKMDERSFEITFKSRIGETYEIHSLPVNEDLGLE